MRPILEIAILKCMTFKSLINVVINISMKRQCMSCSTQRLLNASWTLANQKDPIASVERIFVPAVNVLTFWLYSIKHYHQHCNMKVTQISCFFYPYWSSVNCIFLNLISRDMLSIQGIKIITLLRDLRMNNTWQIVTV